MWVYENTCPMWSEPDAVGGGVSILKTLPAARAAARWNRYEPFEGGLLGDAGFGGNGRRHDVLRFDMRGTASMKRCLIVVRAVYCRSCG
jgi:hypothetical protein